MAMNTKLRLLAVSTAIVLALSVGISLLAAQDAEAQARNTKWVKGSWVQSSVPHNAEGHSAHQVVNFFTPQDGYIYNGKVTFTSSKGVDIIAYHDITNQSGNTTGFKIWKIEGKTYGVTTLMTNVTSGTVEFVGSGLVAHSTSSDTYTIVYSADGIARRINP
jgi:hypothetical protein